MIFASFFDRFPVVERARIYILGSLCIEMYNVGLPVCVLRDAPTANMCILKQGVKLMSKTDGVSTGSPTIVFEAIYNGEFAGVTFCCVTF